MSWAVEAQRAWHDRTREELARAWVSALVDRTPLGDLGEIDLEWLGREAPGLIGAVLFVLNGDERLAAAPPEIGRRARALAHLRRSERAAAEVPRDLALLQGLISSALARNAASAGDAPDDRQALLVHLFGEISSAFAEALVEERSGSGAAGTAALAASEALSERIAEWIGELSAGGSLSLLELEIDGLSRVEIAHGKEAGGRLLDTVADSLRAAVGPAGSVFRGSGGELAALIAVAPERGVVLARRLHREITSLEDRLGIAVPCSIGVAAWPDHASEPAELVEAARGATLLARASGEGVVQASNAERAVQRS